MPTRPTIEVKVMDTELMVLHQHILMTQKKGTKKQGVLPFLLIIIKSKKFA